MAKSEILDPVQFRATVAELEIRFGARDPKKRVQRFDCDGAASKQPISTIYIKNDAWVALGSPEAVRLTIEPA